MQLKDLRKRQLGLSKSKISDATFMKSVLINRTRYSQAALNYEKKRRQELETNYSAHTHRESLEGEQKKLLVTHHYISHLS